MDLGSTVTNYLINLIDFKFMLVHRWSTRKKNETKMKLTTFRETFFFT